MVVPGGSEGGALVEGLSCPFGMVVDKEKYPLLFIASSAIEVYSYWWLHNVGGMFRWVHGEPGNEMVQSHVTYFLMHGGIPGTMKGLGRYVQGHMQNTLKPYGIVPEMETFMMHRFYQLIHALEDHFTYYDYVLGTPHPTLADVLLAAVFEGYFLQDDPPASTIKSGADCVMLWIQRMKCETPEEATKVETQAAEELAQKSAEGASNRQPPSLIAEKNRAGQAAQHNQQGKERKGFTYEFGHAKRSVYRKSLSSGVFQDHVPETLLPVLSLVQEVLPFLATQCEATKLWVDEMMAAEKVAEEQGRIVFIAPSR